ncbi:Protein of unknown function [Paenibacillus catalpae]|uniref:DUF3221 domain-containing protein n=1 Tax=Paenibacillus catalpae TaxID=1045775 RepID=A0A1I2C597_9BACL|nr:DUF3221 domain-containing protein [Paenibacillus catalpae]SFE63509.1 Protein of unknown function [Paenibacillus catalpae]
MNKIMIIVLVFILSITMGCSQNHTDPEVNNNKQSYLEGTIEVIDANNITMLIRKNRSKIQDTDKVWLTPGQSVEFDTFERGQRIRAWVSDSYIGLSSPPQVTATKIEVIQ